VFFAIQYSDGRQLRGTATRQDRVFGFKTKSERSLWIAGGADQARRDALAAADARVKRAKYIMHRVEAAENIGLSWQDGVPLRPETADQRRYPHVYRIRTEATATRS